MGSGIFFPICALPIIIIIISIFNLKEHVKNDETKLYNMLCVANFVGLIIEMLCAYACRVYETQSFLADFILKSYLVYLIIWTVIFTTYIFRISKTKSNNILRIIHLSILPFIIAIIYILPIDVVVKNDYQIHYTEGLSVTFSYLISFIYVLVILAILVINIKNIRNKKYLPVFLFFVIGAISIAIQRAYPQFLLLTYAETLICLCMYFTIENPDVKMIKQLELAKDQANKANAAKTDFLSSMSHEIRTPLNAIVGFSDCINEATTLEEAKENAKDIVNASSTLLEIVNGILDISKIEAGKIEIVNSSYNAPDVFEELAKLITPKMKEKNLDFSYYIAPDIPKVLYGDHANIKKIVTNFLSNAYKYTDKGFVRYEVNCINTKDICKLVISIEDSGRGIKKENVDKMFTKFQRLDEDKNTTIEGTGLGLAITKQLVELMGGRIFVHTVYGQGSKFTVVLNQKIENVDAIEAVKKVKTTLDLNNVKILLVDDNALNIKVATKLLERYNANRITSVDSGFECIERIKNGEKYDLILLDDMMPKMGGVETLHKLKELPDFSIPVIALTANAITGMKEKYLSEGFNNYLAKPIEKEQLVQVFNEVLGRSMTGEIPVPVESQSNNVISDNSQNGVIPVDNIEKEIDINSNTQIQSEQLNNQDDIEQLEVPEDNKTGEQYLRENHVDLDKALELLGDIQMYNETLKDYLNEVEEKWERINKYKEESDMANYAIEVHSLKSDSKYLGFMELADVAYEHELKSKENDIEFVNSNFNRLEEVYNKTLKIAKGYRE